MSQIDAAKAATDLAVILLDVDVLPDDVEDAVSGDEELLELAVARQAVGNAEQSRSAYSGDRVGDLQSAQYDLDVLARDRLGELLEEIEVPVDHVAGANPIVRGGQA